MKRISNALVLLGAIAVCGCTSAATDKLATSLKMDRVPSQHEPEIKTSEIESTVEEMKTDVSQQIEEVRAKADQTAVDFKDAFDSDF